MPTTPKGYWAEEYPLPHKNQGHFGMSMFPTGGAQHTTILPLFRSSEKLVNPENVAVNPRNTAFAEETGVTCFVGSIIPKIYFSFTAKMTKAAIETDKLREMVLYWWPIYTSFHENVMAVDSKTGNSVGDLLELDDGVQGDKQIKILYNGNDLTAQSHDAFSSAAEAFGSWGLSTDEKIEGVTFNYESLKAALRYFTNKGMLRSSLGQTHRVRLNRDRGYHYSSANFTYPKVKRMNEYTLCAVCIFVPPKEDTNEGSWNINHGDVITSVDHVSINYQNRFDEWNSNFDQGAQ